MRSVAWGVLKGTTMRAIRDPHLFAVILAGGEGARLAPLTRALCGEPVPKQFAVIAGKRSLLQATVERALGLVPAERIVVVAGERHEWRARQQLAGWPGIELVLQPRNLDTAPGVLLPLARVRARDPEARVLVLPSDHFVADVQVLQRTLATAAAASRRDPATLLLLGAAPDRPETEYGWIMPGRARGGFGTRSVERFVEKPRRAAAAALHQAGALWNTFMMVGDIRAYWKLAYDHLPQHAVCIDRFGADDSSVGQSRLSAVYSSLPPANFSRDLLERSRSLGVLEVRGAGWSDLGTPRRVFDALAGTPDLQRLLSRLGASRDAEAAELVARHAA